MALFILCLVISAPWEFGGKLVPQVVGWAGLIFAGVHLLGRYLKFDTPAPALSGRADEPAAESANKAQKSRQHFDIGADFGDLSKGVILSRAGVFFGWCLFYLVATAVIGLLPAMLVFLIGYIRLHGHESWKTTLCVSLPACIFAYVLFHKFLRVIWPHSLLGDLLPFVRSIGLLNII
jgi:hypothetical protein